MSEENKDVATTEVEVKKPEFNPEELLAIFDEIMFNGEYKEDIKIKNKLGITFITRTVEQTLEISKKVDVFQANLISTVSEQRAVLNLAYSLLNYNGKDLTKANIDQRLDFIKKLPVPIIAALSDALAKFDKKVDAACKEAEENF